MCGRYALILLEDVLELPFVELSEQPQLELPWINYNVCPTTRTPVVNSDGVLRESLWGLIPHWAKEPPKRPLINARLETAARRNSFREAYRSQRCAVPTSGFFEWMTVSGKRKPFFFPPSNKGELLWLAGLACHWHSPEGERRWTHTILTTDSKGTVVQGCHDRRPVVLAPERVQGWLAEAELEADLCPLGPPYPVTPAVNKASHNDEENLLLWDDVRNEVVRE